MSALRLLVLATILLVAFVPIGTAPVHAQEAPAAAPSDPASAPPAQQQAPTSTSPGNPAPNRSGGLLGFLPDPREWAVTVFTQALVTVLKGINDAIRGVIDGVMGSSLNFVSQTPAAGSTAPTSPWRATARTGRLNARSSFERPSARVFTVVCTTRRVWKRCSFTCLA